jgi:hypothetical protein
MPKCVNVRLRCLKPPGFYRFSYQAFCELSESATWKSLVPDHRVDVSHCQAESEGGAGYQQELPEPHCLPLTERSGQPLTF